MSAISFPPEIWTSILDFATYTPKSLEPDIYSFNDWSHKSAAYRQVKALENSFPTKRAIVSVCRQWKALAMPLLYKCLMLRNLTDISSLLDTLLAHQRTFNSLPLGSYTKRLDVVYPEAPMELFVREGRLALAMLPELLRLLPNLTVLHTWKAYSLLWRPTIFDALIDTCAHSLKVLKWSSSEGLPLESEVLARLLRITPNLRVLAVGPLLHTMPPLNLTNINLDKLVILDLIYLGRKPVQFMSFAHIALPALRELHIRIHDSSHHDVHQFLTVHGKQLRKITLKTTKPTQWLYELLVDLCPRLLVAEFRFDSWQSHVPRSLILLPVKELWLQCRDWSRTPAMLAYLMEHLTSLTEPSQLRAIRLNDSDNVEWLRRSCLHGHLPADWRARVSIPLLDHEGLLPL